MIWQKMIFPLTWQEGMRGGGRNEKMWLGAGFSLLVNQQQGTSKGFSFNKNVINTDKYTAKVRAGSKIRFLQAVGDP
jgi:hypothetical protein